MWAMPKWGYSITELDPAKTVKASGRDMHISRKDAREVCSFIKGMRLGDARKLLEGVVAMRVMVPYRRHRKKVAHHTSSSGWPSGRYPVKAAGEILKVIGNLEANAESKGLDVGRLRIIHASAQPGMKIKKYIPRAFGRTSPDFEELTHIEIVAREE